MEVYHYILHNEKIVPLQFDENTRAEIILKIFVVHGVQFF